MVLYEKREKIHVIDYYIISYQWVYYVLRSFELVYQVKLFYSSRLNVTEKEKSYNIRKAQCNTISNQRVNI